MISAPLLLEPALRGGVRNGLRARISAVCEGDSTILRS